MKQNFTPVLDFPEALYGFTPFKLDLHYQNISFLKTFHRNVM